MRPRRVSGFVARPLNFTVRQHVTPWKLVCLLVLILRPLLSYADAEVLGIDSPQRVHGSFFVRFKAALDLEAIPNSGVGAPLILPTLRPLSAESTQLLAEALCKHMHATLAGAFYFPGPAGAAAGFIVHDAPDDEVRQFLATDPRVAQIGANFAQSTGRKQRQ
jgi:hypothetical protein